MTVKVGFSLKYMFRSGCKIAIGQWIPGGSTLVSVSPGFKGKIDEVRIWNKQLSGADVRSSWLVNVQYSSRYLVILWKFNEGRNMIVKDLKSGVHLYIQNVNHKVQWVYGTASIDILPPVTPVSTAQVTNWCSTYILTSVYFQTCSQLGMPVQTVYYRACISLASLNGVVEAGVDIVVAYSDYCQVSLGLIISLSHALCNEPSFLQSPHIPWSGSSCDRACNFGIRNTNGRCTCLAGFYGSTCSSVCPGGINTRCYGNGVCSRTTGLCTCAYNWYGTLCDRCNAGYYGLDCSLSAVRLSIAGGKASVSISGNGYFIGLGGTAWVYRGTGEFDAIISARLDVRIQLRQVPYGTGVRARGVVVRTSVGVLAIYCRVGTGVIITFNGNLVDKNKVIVIGSGFVYRPYSRNKLQVKGPEGFLMTLYDRLVYFGVEINMDRSFCRDSCGLFGSCGLLNSTNCTSPGLLESFNKSLITQTNIDGHMTSWLIPKNKSAFVDILTVAKENNITAAGTCLFFSQTSLITPPFVDVFHGDFLTIQFYLKFKDINTTGTIFSFVLNNNFAFRINGTLKIHFDSKVFDMGISPDIEAWNYCTFVYHRVSGILEIYIQVSQNVLVTKVFNIGVGAFESRGRLAIGLWQATVGVNISIGGFIGWIDELIMWNMRFDAALIINNLHENILTTAKGLLGLWKFNEGKGWIARDLVGSLHFALPRPPWRSPAWVASDVFITLQSGVTNNTGGADNETKSLCRRIYSSKSLNDWCGTTNGEDSFTYQACLTDVQTSGLRDGAKDSVTSYANQCQAARNLTNLPGSDLCNVFTDQRYDDWSGDACDVICLFGVAKNNTCQCDDGYWGTNCSQECPGGASRPCNNRGKCEQTTGICICDQNWQSSSDCSSCTLGWDGNDCAIAKTILQPTEFVTAIVGSGGILITGQGTAFRLKVAGEFKILQGKRIEAQVRQVPCYSGKSLCLTAVGLSLGSTIISIHAPYQTGNDLVISINGTSRALVNTQLSGINITLPSPQEVEVNYGSKLRVRVNTNGKHVTVGVKMSSSLSRSLGGLLGTASVNKNSSFSNTSFPSLNDLLNESNIDVTVQRVFGISSLSSRLFSSDKNRQVTGPIFGGGFSLFFNYTAIFSRPIVNLFIEKIFTIELVIKMNCNAAICGGPIFSYTSFEMFYISTYSSLRVIIGTQMYDTTWIVETNQWNQVTVMFWASKLEMSVCLTSSQGVLLCKSFKVVSNPFVAGGIIALGGWQPSPNGLLGIVPHTTFVGEIDEFRIWKSVFDYALLQQHWLANLTPDIDGLSGLWKLNEGVGTYVNDLVGMNHLYFPGDPWNKPIWYSSDLPISPAAILPVSQNDVLNQLANDTCSHLFFNGPLFYYCSGLPSIIQRQFFDMCFETVSNTGRNTSSLESVLLYSDYCMETLNLLLWPAQSLCNKFPGEFFPKWIGNNCNVPCIFGKPAFLNSDKCKCNFGYWGVACDQICPGGSKSPCHNHGTCDPVSGRCNCYPGWSGNLECSACDRKWTGSDCSLAILDVSIINRGTRFSGMFGLSLFATLDGHSFNLNIIGEYYLFYSIHFYFYVQIRLVYCYGYSSCVNSIAFRTAAHALVFHGP